jgi:HAD superfamily hydrolase (TIGR01509 family)
MIGGMALVRGLILDLDGTIADSIDFFYELTCEVLAGAGVERPERAAVLEAISLGIPPPTRFLPADFPDREEYLARVYQSRWTEWTTRYGSEIEPLPGACEAVAELAGRGLRIGLVTSSSGELPFLDRWNIRRFFTAVINRERVQRIKPDPEPLLAALSHLGLGGGDVLGVGDSPIDVRAGRAAGVVTIGVLTGAGTAEQLKAEGATVVLPSIAAVPAFLDEQAAAEP